MFHLEITEDGKLTSRDSSLNLENVQIHSRDFLPFSIICVDDEPIYDVELWSGIQLLSKIPKRTRSLETILRAALRGEILEKRTNVPPDTLSYYKDASAKVGKVKYQMNFDNWESFEAYFRVWKLNRSELMELLKSLHSNELLAIELIQNVNESPTRDKILAQVDKCIYNYLSSFSTLIDISRNLIMKYSESLLEEKFQTFRPFFFQPENLLVRELRNYVTHVRLPIAGQTYTFSRNESFKFEIYVLREELLESYKWKAEILDFLKNAPPTLDLGRMLLNHSEHAITQWDWLRNVRPMLHAYEIMKHDSWVNESNWALTGCQHGERGVDID